MKPMQLCAQSSANFRLRRRPWLPQNLQMIRGYEVLISAINRDGFGWKLPLDVIPAVAAQATVDATSTGLFHGLQLRLVNR